MEVKRDWTGLLLEFIVVVLGIAITFIGEALVNKNYEQKEVKSSLQLVRDELIDDIGYVRECDSISFEELQAIFYILANKDSLDKANQDTLYKYYALPLRLVVYTDSREALELLKSSGVFSKIDDKSLALDIIHAYGYLQDYMGSSKMCADEKAKKMQTITESKEFSHLANTATTPSELWEGILKHEEGLLYLYDEQRALMVRPNAQSTIEQVQAIVDKIDRYCKE